MALRNSVRGGDYVSFLRAGTDVLSAMVLADLKDHARMKLLWFRARACHKDREGDLALKDAKG